MTVVSADYADILYFLADCAAATAKDTLAVVAVHMYCTVIDAGWSAVAIIVTFVLNTQLFC